jgi:hypothetical protein
MILAVKGKQGKDAGSVRTQSSTDATEDAAMRRLAAARARGTSGTGHSSSGNLPAPGEDNEAT